HLHARPVRIAAETESAMTCKKCLVSGRVQGVYYRATAARRAHELGVHGYARNLPDGRVEVLVYGEDQLVSAFVQWLWIGSSASKVTAVEVSDALPEAVQTRAGFHTS
ncbi:MAG TPA: acylphosphatase, partial [Stellaceae bacterium]|nr:acylphosphatase [Stellaceae bacterium]